MTGKIIRILFISLLLTVNTLVYFVFFQPNLPKHLSYIPDDAIMVFTVNTKEISGKLAYSALFNEADFMELIESDKESDIDWSENINNGLNFFGRITLLFLPNPDSIVPVSCVMLDVSSEKSLRKFLEKQSAELEKVEEGITYAATENGATMFNSEVALLFAGEDVNNVWKKSGMNVLLKRNTSGRKNNLEAHYGKDFIISSRPGIEKMTDAPALKGMLGSFIQKLIFSGQFQEEYVAMNYELVTDSVLMNDVSKVFDQHQNATVIPEELQQGIFNFHMTFHPEEWIKWIRKGNLLPIPDSISSEVYEGLSKSLGNQFVMQVNEVRLLRIDLDSTVNGMKMYPVPEFKASFTLSDAELVNYVFEQLVLANVMRKEGDVFHYNARFDLHYHFLITDEVLAVSTTDDFILNPKNQFYGISNWFYFNASNYIEAIPADNPAGYMVKEVMHMVNSIHYGYGYSTGTEGNRLLWEGRMYYTEKKKHSLIETIKFMHKMSGLFVM